MSDQTERDAILAKVRECTRAVHSHRAGADGAADQIMFIFDDYLEADRAKRPKIIDAPPLTIDHNDNPTPEAARAAKENKDA